jgi:hypothetical protein
MSMQQPMFSWISDISDNLVLTSNIYPVEVTEAAQGALVSVYANPSIDSLLEACDATGTSILSGDLISYGTYSYTYYPPEACDATGTTLQSGDLISYGTYSYTYYPPEACDATGTSIQSGTLVVALQTYSNYPVEGCDATGTTLISGTLT